VRESVCLDVTLDKLFASTREHKKEIVIRKAGVNAHHQSLLQNKDIVKRSLERQSVRMRMSTYMGPISSVSIPNNQSMVTRWMGSAWLSSSGNCTPITATDKSNAIEGKNSFFDFLCCMKRQRKSFEEHDVVELPEARRDDIAQEKLLHVVESLERQVKEKNVSVLNLEEEIIALRQCHEMETDQLQSHINRMNEEIIVLRQFHEMETDQLHNAFDALKAEASQLVGCLKKSLAKYQGKERAEDIADDKSDSGLESLTMSEKVNMLNAIEEERNQWIGALAGGISRLDMLTTKTCSFGADNILSPPAFGYLYQWDDDSQSSESWM